MRRHIALSVAAVTIAVIAAVGAFATPASAYIGGTCTGIQQWVAFTPGPAPRVGTTHSSFTITCPQIEGEITATLCLQRSSNGVSWQTMVCVSNHSIASRTLALQAVHACSYTTYPYEWRSTTASIVFDIAGGSWGAQYTSGVTESKCA